MGTGVASAIAIVVGSVAVVCGIIRIFCYYMSSWDQGISHHSFNAYYRAGPGPVRSAPLILTGLGLINLHAWPWPDSVDRHDASLVLSLVMCGASLFLMVTYLNIGLGSPFNRDDDGFGYGLGTLLLGAGNALIQLSLVRHQPSLSYWGSGAAILGSLIAILAVLADFQKHNVLFRWRLWWGVRDLGPRYPWDS